MRRRGNQIKMEHVLIGLLLALLLPLAYFLKGDDEQDASEMEAKVTYEEKMPEEMGLHAYRLTLYRPFDGDRIEITAKAPAWAGDVESRIADSIRV